MSEAKQKYARLVTKGITCVAGDRQIVRDCSIELGSGELVLLVGPNGAGKTSLLRAIAGLTDCDGEILCDGDNFLNFDRELRARTLSYLPQGGRIHWSIFVRDVVAMGRMPYSGVRQQTGRISDAAIENAMKQCGVFKFRNQVATELSGGERARVLLARAIATEADFFLADEPLASLDPKYQLEIMECLRDCADSGVGILAVVHDINIAVRYANRIIVMNEGAIVGDGKPYELLEQGVFDEVFGVQFNLVNSCSGNQQAVVLIGSDPDAND